MTGTNTFTPTDLQHIINEVWSPKVEKQYEASLLAADFFTDDSAMLAGGGDTIHITDIFSNVFTSSAKSNTAEVTLISPAQSQINLTVSTWNEISFLIEDKEMKQMLGAANMPSAYVEQAGYVMGQDLDTAIMALYSDAGQVIGDSGADITDPRVREALESIEDGDSRLDDAAFFFHPTILWHDLMGISKYTSVYDSTPVATGVLGDRSGKSRLQSAFRGMLYGVPCFSTTQVQEDTVPDAYFNILANPRAWHYAVQSPGSGRVRSQSVYLQQNLGTLWTTDSIYGVVEVRDADVVVLKSRQTNLVS